MRNSQSNRIGYYTRAKLYKSAIDNENERIVKRDFSNYKVFYSKDNIDFKTVKRLFSNVSQENVSGGYIETVDLKEGEIKPHDVVEYGGKRYNVEEVQIIDNNTQKAVTRRPIVKTVIKIERIT